MPIACPVNALPINESRNVAPIGARPLRLGYIALADAAPLIVAHETGLFRREGLRVELSREMGWASIRDKLLYRELDAAHALGAMPLAATLGIGSPAVPCSTGFVFNAHGNAITLARRHWENGVRDEQDFSDYIKQRAKSQPLVFGVVLSTSSHHFLMRLWLRSIGVNPDADVRIVVLPPTQVFRNLAAGTLDGYCVGEPWNSLAARRRAGWVTVVSAELAPAHPEKVLMVRQDFASGHGEEHAALIRALKAAGGFCEEPTNRGEIVRLLARPEYLNCPPDILEPGFSGLFDFGNGHIRKIAGFHRFAGKETNRPDPAKGQWFLDGLQDANLIDAETLPIARECLDDVYSAEIYDAA